MPGIASFATSTPGREPAATGTHGSMNIKEACIDAARRAVGGLDPNSIDVIICAGGAVPARDIALGIGAATAWPIDLGTGCIATHTGLKIASDLIKADANLRRVLLISASDAGPAGAVLVDEDSADNEILATAWMANGTLSNELRADRVSVNHLLTAIECAVTDSGYTVRDIAYVAVGQLKPATREFLLDALDLDLEEHGCAGGTDVILALEQAVAEQKLEDGALVVLAAAEPPHNWAATCVRWGARAGHIRAKAAT